MWIGREVWCLAARFGSATTKDIDKRRIMIGRDCGFFVVVDSVSSLAKNWNRGGVISYWAQYELGKRGLDA